MTDRPGSIDGSGMMALLPGGHRRCAGRDSGLFPRPWYAATIVLLMAQAMAEPGVFVVQTTRQPNSE